MPKPTVLLLGGMPEQAFQAALSESSIVEAFDVVVAESVDSATSALTALDVDVPVVVIAESVALERLNGRLGHAPDAVIATGDVDSVTLRAAVLDAVEHTRIRLGLSDLAQHLREVLDALGEGVIVRSPDGRIVTANARAEAMFGVSVDTLRTHADDYLRTSSIFNEDGTLCDPEDLPSAVALRTGEPVPSKVISVKRPGGPRLWLDCSATLLRSDVDGSITGVVTSVRDLTDRRSADESLRFRSHLLDAVGQAVIANDGMGRVLYWNAAAERTFGWSAVDALGQPVTDMVMIDTEQAADIVEVVASGETWTGEVSVRRRDGSSFRALASDTPVFDDAGQLIAIIGVLTDVTSLYEINESMVLQSALLSAVGQCIVATDVNDRVIYWNPAATREFGWTEEEILGKDASATLTHETRLELARELEEKLRRGEAWTGDLLMKRKDGSVFIASVSTSPVRDESGEVVKFIAVMVDVTERREAAEAALRLSAIVESTGDAVMAASLDGQVLSWNAGAERLLGYTADEVVGTHFTSSIPPDRMDEVNRIFARAREGVITEGLESARLRKDGSMIEVSLTLSPWRDADGRIAGVSTIARDISDRKRMERELEHQALHDPLTNLPNRTLLADRISQSLAGARRRERQVALLFLNVERFKVLNDAAGHPAGDRALVEIARRLQSVVRPGDTLGRFGSDEFVILCEASHVEAPLALAERLEDAVAVPLYVDGSEYVLSASIGIALSDEACTADSLLRDADAAMYQARAEGRGRIKVFDAEIHQRDAVRLAAPARLQKALDDAELVVQYQPVVKVSDESLCGFEALVRWQHPDRGLLPPSEFIGLAEETGLVVQLGEHVLRLALAEAGRWMKVAGPAGLPILSVNLSSMQLAVPGLSAMVAEAIAESGWPAHRVALEVTETVVMDDIAHSMEALRALREIGVRASIDDFGTGYSSLSYLKQLPVDAVKIDRSFIDGLGVDPNDSAIVEAIIALARTLNLYVVAEGVETRQQLDELRRLGCDYAQGYLWSPAVPADTALEWVREGGMPRSR